MIIIVVLLAVSILVGIAGSIILILGINNKKTVSIVIGSIMLFFTVLFCAGAIHAAAMHQCCMRHDRHMMKGSDCCPQYRQKGCCKNKQMMAPCCINGEKSDSSMMDNKKPCCHKK